MVEQFDRALRLAGARVVENVAGFLPGVLVLVVLLALAWVVARVVRSVLRRALVGLDFDRRSELLGFRPAAWSGARNATGVVTSLVYWAILSLGLLLGLSALDAALPSHFAVTVLAYIPHLVGAVAVFVLGWLAARFFARAVVIAAVNAGLRHARILSGTVKWLVLILGAAMALDHIGIGRTVLLLAFGILFGGLALAAALAIGLGASGVVGRALERQLGEASGDDRLDHV